MNRCISIAGLLLATAAHAQIGPVTPPPPAPPPPPTNTVPAQPGAQPAAPAPDISDLPWTPPAVEALRAEAARLRHLVHSADAERFLVSVTWLPVVEDGRSIYIERKDGPTKRVLNKAQYEALPEADRAAFKEDHYTDYRFYYTRYGTPLAYCRPLDLVCEHVDKNPLRYRKILDYGYGTIGHLRLLASIGNDVVGVDVDPRLAALYSDPSDTGVVQGVGMLDIMNDGKLTLLSGHWPGDKAVADAAGGGYDLIISKNTLKNGYINPEHEVDKRLLVDLGVPQKEFVDKVAQALKPGGLFMIYNICPAQKPKAQDYIPWADGRCPFPKEMLEKAGLKVLEYNTDDTPAVREMARALGWDKQQEPMDIDHDLFATYTLAQRPPDPAQPSEPAAPKSKP